MFLGRSYLSNYCSPRSERRKDLVASVVFGMWYRTVGTYDIITSVEVQQQQRDTEP